MAIIQQKIGAINDGVAFDAPVTANNSIVVLMAYRGDVALTVSDTVNGATYEQPIGHFFHGNGSVQVSYIKSSAAGTPTVTQSGTANGGTMILFELSGMDTGAGFVSGSAEGSVTDTSSPFTPGLSITPADAVTMLFVVAGDMDNDARVCTGGAGDITNGVATGTAGCNYGYATLSSGGAKTAGLTMDAGDTFAMMAYAFKIAAAGQTMTAAQGSYALTGQDAGLFAGFGITAGQGTYNLTGQAANLLQQTNVAAGQGTYNLTGQAATTSYGGAAATTMVAAQGSYALNGQSANLLAGFGLVAGQGQYTLSGQNANTSRTRAVDIFWLQVAGNAGYAYEYGTTSGGPYTSGSGTVGTDVLTALLTGLTERTTYFWRVMALPDGPWSSEGTFTTGIPPLVAEQGSYALTGQNAITGVGRGVSAAQGAYALNGQAASLLAGYTLVASQGAYALSGQDALTSKTGGYVMGAGVGSYSLNGQDVVTSRSGVTAMLADQGSYSLFGQDVVTNKSSTYVMVATSGNYDLQGQDTILSRTVVVTLTAETGLYALSGQDIGFKCTYALIAEYGNYTVTFMGTGAGGLNVFFIPCARRHIARL